MNTFACITVGKQDCRRKPAISSENHPNHITDTLEKTMKIKSNIRAGKNSNSAPAASSSSKEKSAGTVVTYVSPLAYLYTNRCSGV